MSIPLSEPSKITKTPIKRHSYDCQNYSKCQESIDAIEKLRLHEFLIGAEERTQSLDALKKDTFTMTSKNAALDSLSTLKPDISESTNTLKFLERPKRPPPAIPTPKIASEPNL